jgi:4-oxalocrotonate tautomerase
MPLVHIDLPADTPRPHLQEVADAVHQALTDTFNVLPDNRFQTLARRAPDELVCTPTHLGVRHSDRVVFVQVTCAPGRSLEMKKALYAQIARGIAAAGHFTANDVIVNLVESARENWSFGDGIAQLA